MNSIWGRTAAHLESIGGTVCSLTLGGPTSRSLETAASDASAASVAVVAASYPRVAVVASAAAAAADSAAVAARTGILDDKSKSGRAG